MNVKKILIFSLAYYPRVGGAEIAIKEITDRLSDIEFHMVTLRFDEHEAKEEKIGNVVVHRVGGGASYAAKIMFIPEAAAMALNLHKKYKFDGAWAMMSYMALPLVFMRMLGTRVPYVLTLQEGDPFEHVFKRWYIRPFASLLRSGFKHTAIIQTISTYLAGWARQQGYKGTIEVIPNGVDIQKFVGEPVAHDGTILITTSRLVKKNAVDDVIRALPPLPQVRFQILGVGPDEAMLKALAKKLEVEDNVEFVGHVDHTQMPAYLHKADIFIRPSRSEGMGNSFVEAMAAGLPVVATQEGGIADFLFDAKRNPDKETTGWAVDKDNPKQIARAVKEILGNPQQTKYVVENAKKMLEAKYDWNTIASDMKENVFNKL